MKIAIPFNGFSWEKLYLRGTFNIDIGMLDLKQLTADVCRIATEAWHFLKEERKNFRRERVEEKHAHDYVSYVDKESEVRVVRALSA